MELKIDDDNKEYDLMLVSLMWKAWKQRPLTYSDASGASSSMRIDTIFKKSGAKEPDAIDGEVINYGEGRLIDLEFHGSRNSTQRHNIRLDESKAKELVEVLQNFIEKK